MRGKITAPKGIITGAFNLRIAFLEEIELTASDVVAEVLEGDALGHDKDSFGGSGRNYHILCYIPDARAGKSRISVNKAGVDVTPVEITYDTIRTITPTWRTPVQRGSRIEIPVSFDAGIENLRKRNFRVSPAAAFQLYGAGDAYSLVLPVRVQVVSVFGTVWKSNGIQAEIEETKLGVGV